MVAFLKHRGGERIEDRYEVLSVLGSGAFGTVYKCRDVELDTLVAIKELHVLDDPQANTNEREQALAQFRREAVNLSYVRHPHIVWGHYQPHSGAWMVCPVCGYAFRDAPRCPIHNAAPIAVRQRHYLVMEYLDGLDLAEAALDAGGTLPLDGALRYVRQIAEALQLIHARGLVHRDIKPENVRLRASSNDAVLLDFGISTQSGEAGDFSTRQHHHTSGGGTPGYAPDSPQERRFPDARSDIHALGMTLYHLVTGRDPLDDEDLHIMRSLRPRDLNAAIPPAVEALILKAIDPDPLNRHQNAAEFLQEMTLATSVSHTGADAVAAGTAAYGHVPATAAVADSVAPVKPFTFRSGESAHDVAALVRLMDLYPQEARGYLYNNYFALWFRQIGREDLAQRARQIRDEYPDRKYQGLEALAQATGLVEPPALEAQPRYLDFGTVAPGTRWTVPLQLHNVGRGYLFGVMRSTHEALEFDDKFEGNRFTVPVTLDAYRLERGEHQGEIIIDSSAGELRVPFSFTVRGASSFGASATIALWAMLGLLSGQLLRSMPMLQQHGGQEWLVSNHSVRWWPAAPLFGLIAWGVLILLTIGEATRRRSWAFLLSAGTLCLPMALLCAVFGTEMLKAGDAALRPLLSDVVPRSAADAWMIVGGIAGAAYGTLRRLPDVFSSRVVNIFFGWIIFVIIMYGLLWSLQIAVPAH
jgi:Protein kinase domain